MQQSIVFTFYTAKSNGRARAVHEDHGFTRLVHGLHEHLLHLGQFDVLLIATLTFHLSRDTSDDDDGIGSLHIVSERSKVHEVALADITTQHGELSVAVLVFDHDVIGLTFLHRERLILRLASEAEETTTTRLRLFHHFTVHLQHIAVIRHQRVLHLTCKVSDILTTHTNRKRVTTHTLGKAPGTEGREVQFVIVVGLSRLTSEFLIIKELHLRALSTIEVLQMVDGVILIIEFTGLLVDHVGTRHGGLDTLQQRVLVVVGRRTTIVSVQQLYIVGIRT